MDTPNLNFGLVRLGESVCRPLQLTNHSNCIVQYELRQMSEQKGDNIQEVELPIVVSSIPYNVYIIGLVVKILAK